MPVMAHADQVISTGRGTGSLGQPRDVAVRKAGWLLERGDELIDLLGINIDVHALNVCLIIQQKQQVTHCVVT